MNTSTAPKIQTTYFKGDLAKYTGRSQKLHGGIFYEMEMLEGHLIGQFKWTQRAPTASAS